MYKKLLLSIATIFLLHYSMIDNKSRLIFRSSTIVNVSDRT